MEKDRIVDFPGANEKVSKEQIHFLNEILEETVQKDSDAFDFAKSIATLLSMEEDDFRVLAPGILESYKQSVNNPNDKLALVQALNAAGATAEDFVNEFHKITEAVEEIEGISNQKKAFVKEMMSTLANAIADTEGIAKKTITIPIELCHENAKVPQYAHTSDSGMDIFALDDITIAPGETKLVPTGIKVALPPGYEFQVRPKSGRALKTKLRISNTPGTIKVA